MGSPLCSAFSHLSMSYVRAILFIRVLVQRSLVKSRVAGFESSIHMSEEAHNARTAVPWAIVRTVGISSLIGWG